MLNFLSKNNLHLIIQNTILLRDLITSFFAKFLVAILFFCKMWLHQYFISWYKAKYQAFFAYILIPPKSTDTHQNQYFSTALFKRFIGSRHGHFIQAKLFILPNIAHNNQIISLKIITKVYNLHGEQINYIAMLVATKLPHGSPGIECCQTKMLTSTKNGPQIKKLSCP